MLDTVAIWVFLFAIYILPFCVLGALASDKIVSPRVKIYLLSNKIRAAFLYAVSRVLMMSLIDGVYASKVLNPYGAIFTLLPLTALAKTLRVVFVRVIQGKEAYTRLEPESPLVLFTELCFCVLVIDFLLALFVLNMDAKTMRTMAIGSP